MRSLDKSLTLVLVVIFLTSLVIFQPAAVRAQSKTIIVPDNYSTIQAAINHANSGDTVFVKDGIYNETLVMSKSISLIGQDANSTIIDANNATENIIYINASYIFIENFTIGNNKVSIFCY